MDQWERERQARSGGMQTEMLERAERMKQEALSKAAAAQKLRQAAQQAKEAKEAKQAAKVAAAARSIVPLPSGPAARRMIADETASRGREMPHSLQALLAQPSWRTAIIMAEILSPPLALRDPDSPGGTTPPSMTV